MAEKKIDVDWEAIQREYRTGVLSVREIARIHKISHTLINRRVKKYPNQWKRDLTKRVRVAVQRKITVPVSDDPVSTLGTEDEIVEAEANRQIAVLGSHQKSIAKVAAIEEALSNELHALQGKKAKKDGEKPPALSTKVSTLLALVSAQEKRVRLERQAFGITDNIKPDEDPITGITIIGVLAGDGNNGSA